MIKKSFLSNINDCGIIEVWFSSISYSLVTSMFIYLYLNSYSSAIVFAIISYVFTGIKVIHGTREPYEKLKQTHVRENTSKFISGIYYIFFLYVRIQIMFAPIQVILWAHKTGYLPE